MFNKLPLRRVKQHLKESQPCNIDNANLINSVSTITTTTTTTYWSKSNTQISGPYQ